MSQGPLHLTMSEQERFREAVRSPMTLAEIGVAFSMTRHAVFYWRKKLAPDHERRCPARAHLRPANAGRRRSTEKKARQQFTTVPVELIDMMLEVRAWNAEWMGTVNVCRSFRGAPPLSLDSLCALRSAA
jgi:hypothetical protein